MLEIKSYNVEMFKNALHNSDCTVWRSGSKDY
jgi:hypothetical protein